MTIWNSTATHIEGLNSGFNGTMVEHLGIEMFEVGDNWLKGRMPVDHRTRQPHGRLHGGASVALAETLGSMAANMTLDGEHAAVGLEVNANHIGPMKEGFVYGTATAEALGRTTQVWSIRITDEDGRLVCLSRITMAVIPLARA
jgi:1,4-dihydroxy-2-naphthoyl-CoA hydrolase